MKRIISFILSAITALACISSIPAVSAEGRNDILVAYFSATGTTEKVAESIQSILGADIYEIEPAVPYTSADLNYSDSGCRANLEQNDDSARPEISGSIDNIEQYDIIFLGYPIWWGKLPKIIYTFLEGYDFSGKMLIPFCTSGGSGISTSVNEIKALEPDADINEGRRFSSSSESTVKAWTDSLNLPEPKPAATPVMQADGVNVTAENVPDNSSLILAFYKNNALVNVSITSGSGTISDDVSNKAPDADMVKAFLWDMREIKPLCDALQINRKENEEMQIKIASEDYEIIYRLNDSTAAKELYAQLPLTTEAEPFSDNEITFYPPVKLNTANTPLSEGKTGSLSYYAPWGDVVMFYAPCPPNGSLYELGEIVSGAENISKLSGTITVSAFK